MACRDTEANFDLMMIRLTSYSAEGLANGGVLNRVWVQA